MAPQSDFTAAIGSWGLNFVRSVMGVNLRCPDLHPQILGSERLDGYIRSIMSPYDRLTLHSGHWSGLSEEGKVILQCCQNTKR